MSYRSHLSFRNVQKPIIQEAEINVYNEIITLTTSTTEGHYHDQLQ
jgi:hypothetical protein